MGWNWRKVGIVTLVSVLVVVGIAWFGYQYMLYRYSQQIEDLLSELANLPEDQQSTTALDQSEGEQPAASDMGGNPTAALPTADDVKETPQQDPGSPESDGSSASPPDGRANPQQPLETNGETTGDADKTEPVDPVDDTDNTVPSTPPESEPTPPSHPTDGVNGTVTEVVNDLDLSDSEMAMVGDLPSLIGQMTSQEKLLLLKTLTKFTPNELLHLYRLYEGGDAETKEQVKEQVKAKFNQEDIDLIKQMVGKYR